ncbi:MAG: hypothetical protein GW854_01640 [Erythrobacter sp.]|nr:hypothetical protein [Erythrobacter sp.]
MRRQIREALAASLEGIENVRILQTHRIAMGVALAEQGTSAVCVFPIADLEPQRINNAIQGPKPTYRSFQFGVAIIVNDEDAEDGRLDEIDAEIERRIFAEGTPLRALATRDIISRGGEPAALEMSDSAYLFVTVYELVAPMREGEPTRSA